ncbi:MurR/RpiR family transcriptional regulator [Bremerella sp. P1]|uniref:MurR/RpiR family transcriptional regulator n=1 Tax=Bremerella sp. P1 TaxID=3026424 RepID=UPI002368C17B|nr:MurR/RpiR family transcriptional regulator [Bremerella sp. P1]WDI43749.1 MurR/RpiR family transcriptional regulator [Bremerella sp. P1]
MESIKRPLDIVSKIKAVQHELRDSERKVAHVILGDLGFAGKASINELAARAGVSEASISRFAKRVGCKNVRELKTALVSSFAIGERFIEGFNDSSDDTAIGQVAHGIFQAVKVVRDQTCAETVKSVAQAIDTCRRLVVFGGGGGGTVASADVEYRLFRLGIDVRVFHDTTMQRMIASTLNENDVVLIVSTTGEIPEINENALVAKQYGATLVSITRGDSSLARESDLHLHVHIDEPEGIFRPTASRYAILAVIDAIALTLANLRTEVSRELIRRIKYNLDDHRGTDKRFPVGD